ncbi:hypothetical protein ACFYWN_29965 [Streptomyces sp. NPDC002917]|uniref:hypothetical protein n=1 Tax=Streptomyces sp. NPDC002917 TaxID=3364671 RepID=UPI00369FBEE4
MTNTQSTPLADRPPSPLSAIRQMRADSQDSVVAVGSQTDTQATAYVHGSVDEAITALATSPCPPHAIFVTGSAGGGKSGAAEYQRQGHEGRFSAIVEDATHADSPGEDQADSLARKLGPLADDAVQRPGAPLLVAANIGMLIQLAPMWKERGYRFTGLIHQLFSRLGLPVSEPAGPLGLPLEVAVLNLDHRPTSGQGGLLPDMLQRLSPGGENSLFDARRCGTCPAISHCPAYANAVLLSSTAGTAFDKLARRAAVARGRSDTPRALWDLVSRVILPPQLYDRFADPCEASMQAYRDNDAAFVLAGLLPVTAFTAGGEVGSRVTVQAPALAPTREAYEAFANAGLRPAQDAEPLRRLAIDVVAAGLDAPALRTAAEALEGGFSGGEGVHERAWRDTVARTVIGTRHFLGELPDPQGDEEESFFRALRVYDRWQVADLSNSVDTALEDEVEEHIGEMVAELAEGFAALFGARAGGSTFLPVHNYDAREQTRAHVQFRLSLSEALPMPDKPSRNNPEGARRVGYRPMAITLLLEPAQDGKPGVELAVDLPSYQILSGAKRGMASSGDAERIYALRRAAGTLARLAAAQEGVAMLVDDPESECRYIVEPRRSFSGKLSLSARMVTE